MKILLTKDDVFEIIKDNFADLAYRDELMVSVDKHSTLSDLRFVVTVVKEDKQERVLPHNYPMPKIPENYLTEKENKDDK